MCGLFHSAAPIATDLTLAWTAVNKNAENARINALSARHTSESLEGSHDHRHGVMGSGQAVLIPEYCLCSSVRCQQVASCLLSA